MPSNRGLGFGLHAAHMFCIAWTRRGSIVATEERRNLSRGESLIIVEVIRPCRGLVIRPDRRQARVAAHQVQLLQLLRRTSALRPVRPQRHGRKWRQPESAQTSLPIRPHTIGSLRDHTHTTTRTSTRDAQQSRQSHRHTSHTRHTHTSSRSTHVPALSLSSALQSRAKTSSPSALHGRAAALTPQERGFASPLACIAIHLCGSNDHVVSATPHAPSGKATNSTSSSTTTSFPYSRRSARG
jgi:hypothetical protein